MQRNLELIMKNIHHQILEELKFAPYLPANQLQNIMDDRFILENLCFKICIIKNSGKNFRGVKILNNKTQSIIKNNMLLEVLYGSK